MSTLVSFSSIQQMLYIDSPYDHMGQEFQSLRGAVVKWDNMWPDSLLNSIPYSGAVLCPEGLCKGAAFGFPSHLPMKPSPSLVQQPGHPHLAIGTRRQHMSAGWHSQGWKGIKRADKVGIGRWQKLMCFCKWALNAEFWSYDCKCHHNGCNSGHGL